jgi:antitoxin component of MazEF toxin-antitoxin module
MRKATIKEGFIIELPKEAFKKMPLKDGDWLIVRLLNGKEVVLEKPKRDYWDETFAWGKRFAKEQRIKPSDVIKAIGEIRSGK